jgi:DNA-directed RNA polymerase subunit H
MANEKKEETKKSIEHILVPKHELCNEEELKKILSKYNIKKRQLPSISTKDPAIAHLGLERGVVIRIERKSRTNLKTTFFRRVVK